MSAQSPDARRAPRSALVASLAIGGVALALFPPGLNPFGPAKFAVTCALAALACMTIALDPVVRMRVMLVSRTRIAATLAVLAVLAVLSLLTATDTRRAIIGAYPSYTGLLTIFGWMAIAACVAGVAPDDARRFSGRGAVIALCGVGLYALLQRLGLDPLPAIAAFDSGRAASTLGNAVNLGAYVALALPLAADRILAEEARPWRLASGVALVLGAAAAGFSGSRGAWLGIASALLVWVAFTFLADRGRVRRLRLVAIAIVAVVALSIVATPVSSARVVGGGTASATAQGRLRVWSSTLRMIEDRPFLGVGPSGFGPAYTQYSAPSEVDPRGRVEALEDPHNIILSTAASTGVPGALTLAVLVSLLFSTVWRGRSGTNGAWAAVLGGALAGLAVAMQFHFLTLDTGAAAAVIVGSIAGLTVPANTLGAVRAGRSTPMLVATAAFVCLTILAVGGVASDVLLRSGFAAADVGAWSVARESFAAAERLAPWEPSVSWAAGRAATDAVTSGASGALTEGVEAFLSAEARMPGDGRVPRDLGDMFIAGAVKGGPSTLWSDALSAYERALVLAPTDPRAWLGKGVSEAGMGDLDSAARDVRRATVLAPRLAGAWVNLAAIYDAAGDTEAAVRARENAASSKD